MKNRTTAFCPAPLLKGGQFQPFPSAEEGRSGFISNHLLSCSGNAKPGVQTRGHPRRFGETLQAAAGSQSKSHRAWDAPLLSHVTRAQLDPWKLGLGPEVPSHLPAPGRPSQLSFTVWDNSPQGSGKRMLLPLWLCFPFQALMRWDNGCRKVCKCKSIRSICSSSLSYLRARLESEGNASEIFLDLGSLLSPEDHKHSDGCLALCSPGPGGKLPIWTCSLGNGFTAHLSSSDNTKHNPQGRRRKRNWAPVSPFHFCKGLQQPWEHGEAVPSLKRKAGRPSPARSPGPSVLAQAAQAQGQTELGLLPEPLRQWTQRAALLAREVFALLSGVQGTEKLA